MLKYININYSYSKENLILLEIPNEMLSKEDEFRLKIDYFNSSSDVSTNYFYLKEKQETSENAFNLVKEGKWVKKYIFDEAQLLNWLNENKTKVESIFEIDSGKRLSLKDFINKYNISSKSKLIIITSKFDLLVIIK